MNENIVKCNTCPEYKRVFGKNIDFGENERQCSLLTLCTYGFPETCPIWIEINKKLHQ